MQVVIAWNTVMQFHQKRWQNGCGLRSRTFLHWSCWPEACVHYYLILIINTCIYFLLIMGLPLASYWTFKLRRSLGWSRLIQCSLFTIVLKFWRMDSFERCGKGVFKWPWQSSKRTNPKFFNPVSIRSQHFFD